MRLSISYAYVNRYFATSPLSKATGDDIGAMCQIFSQLVPFLVDRKSKAIHPTLSSAITDVWSRLEQVCFDIWRSSFANSSAGQSVFRILLDSP